LGISFPLPLSDSLPRLPVICALRKAKVFFEFRALILPLSFAQIIPLTYRIHPGKVGPVCFRHLRFFGEIFGVLFLTEFPRVNGRPALI
jgi:hypothetical protein